MAAPVGLGVPYAPPQGEVQPQNNGFFNRYIVVPIQHYSNTILNAPTIAKIALLIGIVLLSVGIVYASPAILFTGIGIFVGGGILKYAHACRA